MMAYRYCMRDYISTHSLTKRLTIDADRFEFCVIYFNSQPHEEADYRVRKFRQFLSYFNSQPHEEADDGIERRVLWKNIFQLTASRRG